MTKETLFVDVIVPLAVPNRYTYRVPEDLNDQVLKGKRVLVQFGKSKLYTGIIYSIHSVAPKEYTAKYIEAILDDKAIVNELQLKFWDWMAFYYCAFPGEVMNAALPAGLKLSSTSHVQLNPDFNFEESEHSNFSQREHQLLDLLHSNNNLDFDALADAMKLKSVHPLVQNLLKKNAVYIYEDVKDRYKPKMQLLVCLSESFQTDQALNDLLTQLEKKAFKQAEVVLKYLQVHQQCYPKHPDSIHQWNWIPAPKLSSSTELSALKPLIKKRCLLKSRNK